MGSAAGERVTWIRHDSQRAMHKKLRRAGLAARGLEDAVMEQMAHEGVSVTRGLVGKLGKPNRKGDAFVDHETVLTVAVANGETPKSAMRLVGLLIAHDRWEVSEGGWWVLDYLDFNHTAEEWAALINSRSEAGQASGRSRVATPVPTHVRTPVATHVQTDVATDVEPRSFSVPDTSVSNETSGGAAKRRRSPTFPLPGDFAVTGEMRRWANTDAPGVDVVHQTKRFREWALSVDARKSDWVATWRNWMLKAFEDLQAKGGASGARFASPPAPTAPCGTCEGIGKVEVEDGAMADCGECQGTGRAA